MGFAYPDYVVGIHLNCVALQSPDAPVDSPDEETRQAMAALQRHYANEAGYAEIQRTKPQTIAYALNDSPAGLAAWIVEKFRTWSDCEGDPERRFTKDQLLTNVMIYWVSGAIGSSDQALQRGVKPSFPAAARRTCRGAHCGCRFSQGNRHTAPELDRARLQLEAMDGDGAGRPFRRDGRASSPRRGYQSLLP